MGWTLFWAAGLILILWNQVRTAGILVGFVKTVFLGIGWSLAVGVLIVVASIFGAFGDQLDQSVNSAADTLRSDRGPQRLEEPQLII